MIQSKKYSRLELFLDDINCLRQEVLYSIAWNLPAPFAILSIETDALWRIIGRIEYSYKTPILRLLTEYNTLGIINEINEDARNWIG